MPDVQTKQNLDLAETQQKFNEFYKKNLQSIYSDLENDRRENLFALGRNIAIITGVITIFVLLFYFKILSVTIFNQQWVSTAICLLLLVAGWMLYYPFQRYNEKTKSRTMNKLLSFWGKFRYFHGQDLISQETVKKSELFSYFNRSSSDDAFYGEHKGVAVKVSEHDLRIHGSKGDTVIFKGVMIRLDFAQKFKGKTVVLNKGRYWNFLWDNPLLLICFSPFMVAPLMACYYYFTEPDVPMHLLFAPLLLLLPVVIAWLSYRIYRHFHPKKATQKVVLEGLPFMKKWRVLTDNQVEARYVLTPVFMEKMLEIKRLFHGRHIDFSFFGSKLLVVVHTRKDMFETTSLFVPALSYRKVREVVRQLHSIFAVIDVILNANH